MRILTLAALAALFAMPALAQEPGVIDATPAIDWVLGLIGAALLALVAWGAKKLGDWTGVQIDVKRNEIVNEALEMALGYARARAASFAMVKTDNALIAAAARYALDGIPKAAAHFGLTPARVQAMIEARLGLIVDAENAPPTAPAT